MSTFGEWLRQQSGRCDRVGDLARDLHRNDGSHRRLVTAEDVERVLRARGASDLALEALAAARREHEGEDDRTLLSAGEHAEMGRFLVEFRDELGRRAVQIAAAYDDRHGVLAAVDEAFTAVDVLRCALDDEFAHGCPEDFDPQAYYGGDRGSNAEGA